MRNKPLLSICIPTYDRANLLKEALGSILSQVTEANYDKVEIVIADNSPNDQSAKLVEQLRKKSRVLINYLQNEKNLGYDRNILKVVELASGTYCWFLGDDDLLKEGALDLVLRELASDRGIDVLMGNKEDYNVQLSRQMRFVSLFPGNHDRIYDFSTDGIKRCFHDAKRLICFFNYISIMVVKRSRWQDIPVPEQLLGMGYIHVFMIMNVLFGARYGILKYLTRPIVIRRWSKDRMSSIYERLWLDVEFYNIVAHQLLKQRKYIRLLERLVIKNDGFSWAVRSRIYEGGDYYTKTLPFLVKHYWSYPLFWLKIFPLALVPATVLKLLRNLGLKFIKGDDICWANLLKSDQGWVLDEAIQPGLDLKKYFNKQNER